MFTLMEVAKESPTEAEEDSTNASQLSLSSFIPIEELTSAW